MARCHPRRGSSRRAQMAAHCGSCPRARRRPHTVPQTHTPSPAQFPGPSHCGVRVNCHAASACSGSHSLPRRVGFCRYDSLICRGLFLHACPGGALSSTEEGWGVKAGPRAPVRGAVAASVVFLVPRSACHRSCPVMVSRLAGETCPGPVGCPVGISRQRALREACGPPCAHVSG